MVDGHGTDEPVTDYRFAAAGNPYPEGRVLAIPSVHGQAIRGPELARWEIQFLLYCQNQLDSTLGQ
jgi:hypothetical protein